MATTYDLQITAELEALERNNAGTGWSLKFQNRYYTWFDEEDGEKNKIYRDISEFGILPGKVYAVKYRERPNPKNSDFPYKNIVTITPAPADAVTPNTDSDGTNMQQEPYGMDTGGTAFNPLADWAGTFRSKSDMAYNRRVAFGACLNRAHAEALQLQMHEAIDGGIDNFVLRRATEQFSAYKEPQFPEEQGPKA